MSRCSRREPWQNLIGNLLLFLRWTDLRLSSQSKSLKKLQRQRSHESWTTLRNYVEEKLSAPGVLVSLRLKRKGNPENRAGRARLYARSSREPRAKARGAKRSPRE